MSFSIYRAGKNAGKSITLTMYHLIKPMTRALWQKLKGAIRPPLKVKLTRQHCLISLPARRGGQLYLLPRQHITEMIKFTAAAENGVYLLQMATADKQVPIAQFPTEAEVRLALAKINKTLTGNRIRQWLFRLSLGWLGWLLITSYWQASQQAHTDALASDDSAAFTPPPATSSPAFASAAVARMPPIESGCDPAFAFKAPPRKPVSKEDSQAH